MNETARLKGDSIDALSLQAPIVRVVGREYF
jgi:hypothetical protein